MDREDRDGTRPALGPSLAPPAGPAGPIIQDRVEAGTVKVVGARCDQGDGAVELVT
jgi:hypothetical protein